MSNDNTDAVCILTGIRSSEDENADCFDEKSGSIGVVSFTGYHPSFLKQSHEVLTLEEKPCHYEWPKTCPRNVFCIHCDEEIYPATPIPFPISEYVEPSTCKSIFRLQGGFFCCANCGLGHCFALDIDSYYYRKMLIEVFHVATNSVKLLTPNPPRYYLKKYGGTMDIQTFRGEDCMRISVELMEPPFLPYIAILREFMQRGGSNSTNTMIIKHHESGGDPSTTLSMNTNDSHSRSAGVHSNLKSASGIQIYELKRPLEENCSKATPVMDLPCENALYDQYVLERKNYYEQMNVHDTTIIEEGDDENMDLDDDEEEQENDDDEY